MRESEKVAAKLSPQEIADRICRLRRARGWKQKELAAKIGSTLFQVSKMERGRYVPRASTLVRLADALEVTVDFLLTGRRPRAPQGDPRLRERLAALEKLPEQQRDSLVLFLDALLAVHCHVNRPSGSRRPEGEPRR